MTPASARIRLLIIDDSQVVRIGLRTLLGMEPSFEIVGEAANVAEGVAAAAQLKPDVVLLDIRLPDGSGVDACRQILQQPHEARVLFLTSVLDDGIIDEAIRAGAHGYLLKEVDGRGLVKAIRDVAAGLSALDPVITTRVMQLAKAGGGQRDPLAQLSVQEKRVLSLIAEGCTNKEAAARLNLSDKTVKNYLSTVFEKLHVSHRAQAAVIYAQQEKKKGL
jgi:two-component system response regulator DevR